MNLQPIHPPMAPGSKVQCSRCATMMPADTTLADLDGPAWTYFCVRCRPCKDLRPDGTCRVWIYRCDGCPGWSADAARPRRGAS